MLILKILYSSVYIILKWYTIVSIFNYVDAINLNVENTIPDINKHEVIQINSNNVAIAEQKHHPTSTQQQQQQSQTSDDSFSVYNIHQQHDQNDDIVYVDEMLKQRFTSKVPLELSKKLPHNNMQQQYQRSTSSINKTSAGNGFLLNSEDHRINVFELSKLDELSHDNYPLIAMEMNRANQLKRIRRRKKRYTQPQQSQNICDIKGCTCDYKLPYTPVICNFTEYLNKLNKTTYIPSNSTSFYIRLSQNTRLELYEGFFSNNHINKFVIEGQNNSEHVEILSNAFIENKAPYPEIDIIKCSEIILKKGAFHGELKLNITNSSLVIIFEQSFNNTALTGHFENIKDLRIYGKAFGVTNKTVIHIHNCVLDGLTALNPMKSIHFSHTIIPQIYSDAFNGPEFYEIIFEFCTIGRIQTNAITNRLFVNKLNITGCIIDTIEPYAINKSGISNVIMHNNSINTIEDNAITLSPATVKITNNTIKSLGENWFHSIGTWQNILIRNNKFGEFHGLSVDNVEESKTELKCLFENNYITNAHDNSLNFGNTHCHIRDVYFNVSCSCQLDWLTRISTKNISTESYCKVDNPLISCLKTTLYNVQKLYTTICNSTLNDFSCSKNKLTKTIDDNFINSNEQNNSYLKSKLFHIVIGTILILLIIIIIIVVLIVRKVIKSRTITPACELNSINYNTDYRQNNITANTGSAGGVGSLKKQPINISHDDRIIINQTLENMKEKYPAEKYDQVHNNTKKLLEGYLTESEKILTIGEIVRNLDECESSGEDFVAFTDILYRHLAPKHINQNDPVYSEPLEPIINHLPNNNGLTNLNHIYAEPNSLQQPLLNNEYSSPADVGGQTYMYIEPLQHPGEKRIISPYAIGNGLETIEPNLSTSIYEEPSTSRNLPDVLNESQSPPPPPLPNPVKTSAIRTNFSNNPNYHITRSPTTNRKIPAYTIPSKGSKICSDNTSSDQSHSDHSGGSDITYKMDDDIDYADD